MSDFEYQRTLLIGPQFDTLEEAKECVRLCRRDVYW
jgi:hypothetical protein